MKTFAEIEGTAPEVIFFGVRAFYSVQPGPRALQREVNCVRIPENAIAIGDVVVPAEVTNAGK